MKNEIALFILKGIFSILDLLSNIRFLHKYIFNSKVYIGAAILSVTAIQTSCVRETKPTEPNNKVSEKGIDTASTKKFAKVDSTGNIIKLKKTTVKNKITQVEYPEPILATCYDVTVEPPEPTYEIEPVPPQPYIKVDEEPEFPGGLDSLRTYPSNHIIYPQEAIINGEEGLCVIRFVVGITGKVEDVKLLKSTGFPLLDSEAIRVISSMPVWKPGSNNGEPVRVVRYIPIRFTLPIENTTK